MFFKPKLTDTTPNVQATTEKQASTVPPVMPMARPSNAPTMPMGIPKPMATTPMPQATTPMPQAVPPIPTAQTPKQAGVMPVTNPTVSVPTDKAPTTLEAAVAAQTENGVSPYAKPANYQPPVETKKETEVAVQAETTVKSDKLEPHEERKPNGDKVFIADSVADVKFADLWYTPEGIAYIRDKATKFALIPFETNDMEDFFKTMEQGYTGSSSFAVKFKGEAYRVERVMTTTGVQYNCRKMPVSTPNLYKLGIPDPITKHLATLAPEAGLILFAGPTGMGKTTTASALMKEFLENHGGFLYTIEDPPEMPLDGLYYAKNGALGLCKQSPVENERWEDGLKSALRSRPRYILVGEIRTPEVASQTLRAATSGHLVLSTIHATSVEDALNSMIKYAMGAGLDEKLVSDLLARGILAVVHQKLEGTTTLHPVVQTAFANPNPLAPDQMRNAIREGRISLGTLMEAQSTKMFKNLPMFKEL